MSSIEQAVEDYLRLRRGLGHKLAEVGRDLARFVAYLESIDSETVSTKTALGFAVERHLPSGSTVPGKRLNAVRGFARYLSGIDQTTEIPPVGILRCPARRRVPHLFTDQDVEAVVHFATASTPFVFRQITLSTIIRLLAVTGMRVGEVLRLGRRDVDFDEAVIFVRDSKFGKSRDVPVSSSTVAALAAYAHERDKTRPAANQLFVSLRGTPVVYSHFGLTFRDAVASSGIGAGSGVRPRVHDLRHSFAIRTLLNWYRAGLDAEALLPRLSTYLGHREPRFTYLYLSATPELLALAAARLEATQVVAP